MIGRVLRLGLYVLIGLASLAAHPARPGAQETVALQLKWLHQFQFAGYYAALHKGFYREAGFDVVLREGGPNIDPADELIAGKADYGVCNAGLLLGWAKGRELVSLAAIFQYSPAQLLVTRRGDFSSLSELRDLRLMDAPGSDEVAAMLIRAGVDYAAMIRVPHNGDPRELLGGKAEAMISYTTNEPFVLEQMGVPYRTFSPRSVGIDFYGDILCTSAEKVRHDPKRVATFREASIRGWEYALNHQEEIVDLILSEYSTLKTRDALLFEAARTDLLVRIDATPIGAQTAARWEQIAAIYRDLNYPVPEHLPDGMIWHYDGDWIDRLLIPLLAAVLLLSVAAGGAIGLTRYRARRAAQPGSPHRMTRPRLSLVMSLLFVGLSIPVLIFILVYNYSRNEDAIVGILNDAITETGRIGIDRTRSLINGTEGPLLLLAQLAGATPGYFRQEESRDLLYRALTAAPHIDAAYVSFEDGYHRVVTRIDADRRRAEPQIPANANWHSSYIDPVTDGLRRTRHRTFFDIWPREVGRYEVPTQLNVSSLPGYQEAKASGALVVTPPTINPDTGYPILSVRVPILTPSGDFLGCASANVTMDTLSRFLDENRVSRGSVTFIVNRRDGKIIAHPDKAKAVHLHNGVLEVATMTTSSDPVIREAGLQSLATRALQFRFHVPGDGREMVALFNNFPDGFGQPWQIVTLTPIDDFVGTLRETNRLMMIVILGLAAIESIVIYLAATRLARPVELVSQELRSIENLDFSGATTQRSGIREIAELESAAGLLRNSLRSFASFVPLEVVRHLVRTGIPLTPGVEPRVLTIFFSDLENFSTQAEQLPPDRLLEQISAYLETVCHAISEEGGTVDKFIGDGVMAFWGAPEPCEDHALRGCTAAIRASRRMARLNETWAAEGRPTMRMRVGMNSARVLVGNVGSSERLSYTALGDGVNVAARLEGMNKELGTRICISDTLYESVRGSVVARPIKRVRVKGRKTHFMVYELLGLADSEDPDLRADADALDLSRMTWDAMQLLESSDRDGAGALYATILKRFPDDSVAQMMLRECGSPATETA
ncbi:MAG: ABC transporter substrate-binding protein [Alphaproteobacteria bacterium]